MKFQFCLNQGGIVWEDIRELEPLEFINELGLIVNHDTLQYDYIKLKIYEDNGAIIEYNNKGIHDYYNDYISEELNKLYPNSPFCISCIDFIEDLYKPFTDEKTIIIKDDRASEYNYYYREFKKEDLAQYNDYLVIHQKDKKKITLNQILIEMINSKHYNKDTIREDDHWFLEGFDKSKNSNIEYVSVFGS